MKALLILILSAVCGMAQNALLVPPVQSVASSPTYYVDQTGGSDAADGLTTGTAWKTIAKVNGETFSPGDTILFKRGETWAEKLTFPSAGASGNVITISAYGSGALPIIEAASGRAEAIELGAGIDYITVSFLHLRGGDTNSASALYENQDGTNNIIEDCTVDGQGLADSLISGAANSHTVVRRCIIQNARDDGFTLHTTASGLVEDCSFLTNRSAMNHSGTLIETTVNDCVFQENGDGASSSFGDVNGLSPGLHTFNRCDFRGRADGGDIGYYIGSGSETSVWNYCIFNNKNGSALAKGSFSANTSDIATFKNCIFVGNSGADGASGSMNANPGTITLTNCIFSYWWRLTDAGGAGVVNSYYNIRHAMGSASITTEANLVGTGDPLFVNYATGDFELQAGSAGVNAGIAIPGLTIDFSGAAVSDPPEVGAYER